jgi:spore germination cell wall hydrolase CwlJ-like protein
MTRILLVVISFFVGVIWCKLGHAFEKEILDPTTEPDAVCLAQNIYFEASVEPTAGKIAVGLVALNRMHDARYPDTICGVVKEGPVRESWKTKQHADLSDDQRIYYPIKYRCQFTWYCDGKDEKIRYQDTWLQSQIIALQILEGQYAGMIEGATHYHANWVDPTWRHELSYIGQIGDHLFYRWEN